MIKKLLSVLLALVCVFGLVLALYGQVKWSREDTLKQKAASDLSQQLSGVGIQSQLQISSPVDYQRVIVRGIVMSGVSFFLFLVVWFWPSRRRPRTSNAQAPIKQAPIKQAPIEQAPIEQAPIHAKASPPQDVVPALLAQDVVPALPAQDAVPQTSTTNLTEKSI